MLHIHLSKCMLPVNTVHSNFSSNQTALDCMCKKVSCLKTLMKAHGRVTLLKLNRPESDQRFDGRLLGNSLCESFDIDARIEGYKLHFKNWDIS